MKDFETITYCLLCNANIEMVLSLPATPPANELLSEKITQDIFPLNLMRCTKCSHLQLDTAVDLNRLFKHYLYKSNTSRANVEYFYKYALAMIKRFKLTSNDRVVDIASNDGLFLDFFQKQNIKVLGIDPAENIAVAANAAGIETISKFFNIEVAKEIVAKYGKVSLITCNNMFAHNKDLDTIMKGVKELLIEEGTFIFEVAYGLDMLKSGTFDLLYHEHIHTHTIAPLMNFFYDRGMRIYDVEHVPTHGGSIRVFVCNRSGKYMGTSNLAMFIWLEQNRLNGYLANFVQSAYSNIETMKKLLCDIKQSGKTIGVLGWPAKATLMSYAYELEKYISYVFDDNDLKIGKYTPGKQLEVLSTKTISEHKPDYLLILAWNYAEPLIEKYEKLGIKFILPFPEPKIV